jgi:crotonobetainyl-CoA:carnitine CoA-transferase CaiB-like acyl-CoA transferase
MLLADLGADVVKIEKPGRGDGARYMGAPMRGPLDSDYYLGLNRTKRSLLLDLSKPEARDLAVRLAGACDIVVQNFRPGVMERLGLGYEDLRTARRGLIYCSISAFGDDGPWRDRPANDIIMQSVSGLMGITGEVGGGPVRIGAPISDYSTGLFALTGILAALHARDDHPGGQHIKVSMLDSSLAMMANYFPSVATLGKTIPRLGRGHAQIVPYQAFECADGEYVMVGAFTNGFWRRLCVAVGRPEWADDERFASNASRLDSRDYLLGELEKIFRERTRSEWTAALDAADVPNSPVLELHDALKNEQVVHNGSVLRIGSGDDVVDNVKCPVGAQEWSPRTAAMPPHMGEHSEQILHELLDLPEEEITALMSAGAVGGPDAR